MTIPKKISERLISAIRRFQPVISAAKARDANESDTSMIITDMMAELCGYDKYSEITRELAIRGTYCDLATKIDGNYQMVIEVKAVGIDLKENHIKQAIDYASNKGIEWVCLTNAHIWKIYRVVFSKPIDFDLVLDIDFLSLNPRNEKHTESLYLLTKESMIKAGLYAYHDQLQATNKFYLGAILLSDNVLDAIRKELRRITPDIKITNKDLNDILIQDVIKRDVIDGDKAETARKTLQKSICKHAKSKKASSAPPVPEVPPVTTEVGNSQEHEVPGLDP